MSATTDIEPSADVTAGAVPRIREKNGLDSVFEARANQGTAEGVKTDTLTRALYATDASIYEIDPLGVVFPRNCAELSHLVRLAHEHRVPIIPRGGGTGLAGEALGRAVIFDTTKYMNAIADVNIEEGWVRAEAGAVVDQVNKVLAPMGRKLGPDPASSSRCVIGGVIANNSTGAHSLYYGHFRDHILELDCILSNGEQVTLRPVDMKSDWFRDLMRCDTLESRIYRGVRQICTKHATLIDEKWPHHLNRHRSGYLLHGVVQGTTIDLTKLVCGSEGTLAVVTAAKLRIVEQPKVRGLLMLHFTDIVTAAGAVAHILAHKPYACELLDENILTLARKSGFGYEKHLPEGMNALLYVEFEGETSDVVERRIANCVADIRHEKALAFGHDIAMDADKQKALWQIRKSGEPLLYGKYEHKHPVGFIEDTSVDPRRLAEYVEGKRRIFAKYGVDFATYAHAGAGVLHTRPYLDLTQPGDLDKMERIAEETYDLLLSLGGSISGEHGDGLSRTQFLIKQFGPELYQVFHTVKDLFDPHHLLNMGKIVYNTDPHLVRNNLRHGAAFRPEATMHNLLWKPGELERQSDRCNGCAECRAVDTIVTMCPIFKATGDEAATPRAKGNLMRLLTSGRIDPHWQKTDEFKKIADLCVNCKACFLECPTHVNIPMMMLEAKAEWVRENGQKWSNLALVHAEFLSKMNTLIAPLANWAARQPLLRWGMELVLGIDRRRQLPKFSSRPFLRNSQERYTPAQPKGRKVVYFVDLFANYNDPELAEAFVRVMNHNGVEVVVPPGQKGCGMPAMDYGSVAMAREIIRHNAQLLRPWIDEGYEVITSEPTATLSLKDEYLYFVDDENTQALAAAARDAMEYLESLDKSGELRRDFVRPVERGFGYHAPCHLKALHIGTPGADLVASLPGASVRQIHKGCCGIAGTYGMKKSAFDISMRAGAGLFGELLKDDVALGLSECSTCKMQMEQGSAKTTMHPLKVLAHAYGLMDIRELTTTA